MDQRTKIRFDYLGAGVMMVYCDKARWKEIAKLPSLSAVESAVSHLSVYVKIGYTIAEAQDQIRRLVEGVEPERK